MIGAIKEFNEKEECWCDYFKRFVNWTTLNSLDEKAHIRALIVTEGGGGYFLYIEGTIKRSRPLPNRNWFGKRTIPLVLLERHKFGTTSQKEDETLYDYSLRIQAMREFCDFKDFLDQALRGYFIMGFRDVQNNIIALHVAETDLSFKRAGEIAQRVRNFSAEAKLIAPSEPEIFRMAVHSQSIVTDVNANDFPIKMEVDKGCRVSKSGTSFHGELFVSDQGPSIIGRDWIKRLLDWKTFQINQILFADT
ncbi:hypothetical protein HZS_5646, partial [Henneguya salminicola]